MVPFLPVAALTQKPPTFIRPVSQVLSGPGTIAYLAFGTLLPFIQAGSQPTQKALRTADAVSTSVAIAEALKTLTKIPRPDTGEPDSFPSGHATATFALATVRAALQPKEAGYWYTGAALISASRVTLNRHRPLDVIAGAALGFAVARLELSSDRGLAFSGVITRPTRDLESLLETPGQAKLLPLIQPGKLGVVYRIRF